MAWNAFVAAADWESRLCLNKQNEFHRRVAKVAEINSSFDLPLRGPAFNGMTDRILLIQCRPPANQKQSFLNSLWFVKLESFVFRPLTGKQKNKTSLRALRLCGELFNRFLSKGILWIFSLSLKGLP
jgi:hypothetical protein